MNDLPDTVEQAEAAFYAAFQEGDLKAMGEVWESSDDIVCVHPRGPQLLGYERVMKSWEQILADTAGFRITAELLHQYSDGQLAVRFVNEIVLTENSPSEPVTLLATNAYRNTGSGWRIVLHHASPKPRKTSAAGEPHTKQQNSDVTLH